MTELKCIVIIFLALASWTEEVDSMNRPPKVHMPRAPPVICTADSLMIYQDCRMCVCNRPNRPAKCFKKSCDLRTKDSGQCPSAVLRLDDSRLCPATPQPSCKVDADCPAQQLCCFDFCLGGKCVNPIPLDASSGFPIHTGRGYQ